MSKILTKSNNYLSVFEDYLIKISGISLFVVMILTSFQIISRVLGYPWPGYLELSELSISIFALCNLESYSSNSDLFISTLFIKSFICSLTSFAILSFAIIDDLILLTSALKIFIHFSSSDFLIFFESFRLKF